MARAIWNNEVIAESDNYEIVEGNVYFPKNSINPEFFENSEYHTRCPWKGKASYFHINVKGSLNRDAAWYYPDPSMAARNIKDHVAFWKGVKVEK